MEQIVKPVPKPFTKAAVDRQRLAKHSQKILDDRRAQQQIINEATVQLWPPIEDPSDKTEHSSVRQHS